MNPKGEIDLQDTDTVIDHIFEAGLCFNPRRSVMLILIIAPDMQCAGAGVRYARIDCPRYARMEVQVQHQNTNKISLIVISKGH